MWYDGIVDGLKHLTFYSIALIHMTYFCRRSVTNNNSIIYNSDVLQIKCSCGTYSSYCFCWQKLEAESEDAYMDSDWADNGALKRNFHGMQNIKWGPRW